MINNICVEQEREMTIEEFEAARKDGKSFPTIVSDRRNRCVEWILRGWRGVYREGDKTRFESLEQLIQALRKMGWTRVVIDGVEVEIGVDGRDQSLG